MYKRKWVKFQVVIKYGSGEFDEEQSTTGFIDVNTIESFYVTDKGVVLEMESGNGFLVEDNIDFVQGVMNESI